MLKDFNLFWNVIYYNYIYIVIESLTNIISYNYSKDRDRVDSFMGLYQSRRRHHKREDIKSSLL